MGDVKETGRATDGVPKPRSTAVGTLVYGSLLWAMTRAQASSAINAGVFFIVFRVGPGDYNYRFTRQIVGTRTPGCVSPVASYRDGLEVSNQVPTAPEKVADALLPLTVKLPWERGATFKDVKAAYRRWCKTGHPDVGGDEAVFKAVDQRYRLASFKDSEEKARAAAAAAAAKKNAFVDQQVAPYAAF